MNTYFHLINTDLLNECANLIIYRYILGVEQYLKLAMHVAFLFHHDTEEGSTRTFNQPTWKSRSAIAITETIGGLKIAFGNPGMHM